MKSTVILVTARFVELSIINFINKSEFKPDKTVAPELKIETPFAKINTESDPVVVQHILERLI